VNAKNKHNTDLHPTPLYLNALPGIGAALEHPERQNLFEKYEAIANSEQRLFRRIGMCSLVMATFALTGIVVELAIEPLYPIPPYLAASLECLVIGAIFLALLPRLIGTREKWLTARFMTEQMRLWHFQTWLDGELMSRVFTDPAGFASERARRWARFTARNTGLSGHMVTFIEEEADELFHGVRPYTTGGGVASAFLQSYSDLRIEKQLAYFKQKQEEIKNVDDITETLARVLLIGALICAGIQLAFAYVHANEAVHTPESTAHSLVVTFYAIAITLVIWNAAVRVYRDAHALSLERERYEAKWVRLIGLRSAFAAADSIESKQEIMRQLEVVETRELREFLLDMRRSNFLM
jgi:hypothetical protein